ncbi:MAG: PQQ-binding-like beta-propeller repeat protein [Saprospiraceae bacterium]
MNLRTTNLGVILCLLFLATGFSAIAQEQAWQLDLYEQLNTVSWLEQTNDGTIIAAGDKGLVAIDPATGETRWSSDDFKAVDRSTYFNVDGLPFFYVEATSLMGKTRGVLLNAADGTVLYDTGAEDLRIKGYTMLNEQGAILFEGMSGPNRKLAFFDLKTLSTKWTADLGATKGLAAKVSDRLLGASFISHGPHFTADGSSLVLAIKDNAYGIDAKTGAVNWTQQTKKPIKALVYAPSNNSLYMGVRGSNKMKVLQTSDGADITPGKLKLKGTLLDVVPSGDGRLLLVETEGFNLIEPSTNDLVWKKSYKVEYLDEVVPLAGGDFIAVAKEDKGSEIHRVGKDGKKVWDAKAKGFVYFASTLERGILYISTDRSNILGIDDGKDLWDKDVKFKSAPAVAIEPEGDKVFIFENGQGYRFNLNNGAIEQVGEDIDLLEVNKKTPLEAEAVDAGYFLFTGSHASLIDRSGKLVYSKYFAPMTQVDLVGLGQSMANLAGVDVDIAGSMAGIENLKSLSNGAMPGRTAGNQAGGNVKQKNLNVSVTSGSQTATLLDMTNERYTNAQLTREHMFLTTQDGGKFIYRVNKNTGEVDRKIELKDKDPGYVIDEIDGRVYVVENNKVVTGYSM